MIIGRICITDEVYVFYTIESESVPSALNGVTVL